MASKNNGDRSACVTVLWNIENFSYCWQTKNEKIWSPDFTAHSLEDTEWSLNLYPRGSSDENYIAYFLQRKSSINPKNLEVGCELAFLAEDGSVLEMAESGKEVFGVSDLFGSDRFAKRMVVVKDRKDTFLSSDTLRARCRIWRLDKKELESRQIFARTVISIDDTFFNWDIEEFSTHPPEKEFINVILSESEEIPITFILHFDRDPYGDEKILINIRFDSEYLNYNLIHRKRFRRLKDLFCVCDISNTASVGGRGTKTNAKVSGYGLYGKTFNRMIPVNLIQKLLSLKVLCLEV
ncbi:MATH domain-containing protein [Nephila pilipes]|uniref:MATH domain-containing protein n=1 Tax=Nephila pilipes TaxID=299642 RepID=A0A8X6QDU2_NEPPI|nr:MATH domain-containing protein [Nephila pilipes]